MGEDKLPAWAADQIQLHCIAQRHKVQVPSRGERLGLLTLRPQRSQGGLHWRSQALGRAAEVYGEQGPQRVAELVRQDGQQIVRQRDE